MMLPLLVLAQSGGLQLGEIRHAWLETPGGQLPFGLEFARKDERAWTAFLVNAEERIQVPVVTFEAEELVLEMPHYDSRIQAAVQGSRLVGTWEKRRGPDEVARVPFEACGAFACENPASEYPGQPSYAGRWLVRFETDEHPAVAEFDDIPPNGVRGTFLTATGDYRYLSGWQNGRRLVLSCFDGAHAFLFHAEHQPDGSLKGDFWSGNWHHETWTAKRDEKARLDDPFAQTRWNGRTKLADLVFPDLDGNKRSLGDLAGKATLLVVLGSWCPNCNDEAKLLADLDEKYGRYGLSILGLAFELTGESERDAKQVRIFAERHQLSIPFFLCGTADKDEATKALGLVDRVRAFPTTVFVGADGLPRAIHSGFAGPATGEEHKKLRREFEARIEALLEGR